MKKFLCYDTNDAASGKINVDNRGMLKPNSTVPSGSTPYQQLVTDGTGTAKWEDRLAYDDSKLVVDSEDGFQIVKVADEIPSWAFVDSPMKVWISTGYNITENPRDYTDLGNGSFSVAEDLVFFFPTDNFDVGGVVIPEKGVYFAKIVGSSVYAVGIASADSDTPEITWDGNIGVIKKIDEKFLPDQTVFYVDSNDNLTDAEGAKITLEQAKAVGLNFIIQTDYGVAKPIYAFYGNGYASFYAVEASSTGNYGFKNYEAGERPIN